MNLPHARESPTFSHRTNPFSAALALVCASLGAGVRAAPPTYDHVVIVIEENHTFTDIIGNPALPYMNALAQNGALLTDMYGMVHPSQPNYLHLYSGDDQAITTNDPALAAPFSTPNLAAGLLSVGRTFICYSEDLPEVGSTINVSGHYQRKHNPSVNWQSATPGVNQYPLALNRPFTDFPTDFTQLPTVCFVVPNQLNDMHDGTPAQADAWLQTTIGPYAQWCRDHNSLLIVTWDEDSFVSANLIPTFFYGAGVRVGQHPTRWTLHNLLRTIEDMYAVPHAGSAAIVQPLTVFTTDPVVTTARFQQGTNGYTGTHDTWIEQTLPTAPHASDVQFAIDGSPLSQGLLRFDSLFGTGAGQVPPGSTIISAKLSFYTTPTSGDGSTDAMSLHRLTVPFTDASTWDSLVNGISLGTEAMALRDFAFRPRNNDIWVVFDITQTARDLAAGGTNHGWVVVASGTDGWRPTTSEWLVVNKRPSLSISYIPGTDCDSIDFNNDGVSPDLQDIDDFLRVYAGGPCSPGNTCNDIDFDNDSVSPDVADIDALLRVYAGGMC